MEHSTGKGHRVFPHPFPVGLGKEAQKVVLPLIVLIWFAIKMIAVIFVDMRKNG